MLPKKFRLHLKTDFLTIQKKGCYSNSECFTLLYCKSTIANNRFGFIVGKKVSPLAVRRNRVKRLISEAISQLIPEIKTGFDIIIIAKPKIVGKELLEIKEELKKLLFQMSS